MAEDARNPREVNDTSVDTERYKAGNQGNRYASDDKRTENLVNSIDEDIAEHERQIDLLNRTKERVQDEAQESQEKVEDSLDESASQQDSPDDKTAPELPDDEDSDDKDPAKGRSTDNDGVPRNKDKSMGTTEVEPEDKKVSKTRPKV